MGRLQDNVAIVTGGGSGIGRATSLGLAAEGAKVVVADAVAEGGEETARMIRDRHGQALFIRTDVSRADQVKAMVDKTVEVFGRLDCACNSAGINGGIHNLANCTEDLWDRVININLKGTFLCMKFEVMQMRKQGRGSIVNVASNLGLVGAPGATAYVASKHGVVGLTKSAALEYAKKGIRVNAVAPCNVDTPMSQRLIAEHPGVGLERLVMSAPMGRMGKPEEMAEAIVWLCSDAASFVTGHCLPVDGGMVAE